MLTDCQQVILDFVEDGHRLGAILFCSIRKTSAIVQVTSVNKEQVDAQISGSLLHATAKSDKVAPVGAVVLLLQMALEPAVGIGLLGVNWRSYNQQQRQLTHGVEEIDLAPFKGCLWSVCGIGSAGLHALDVTNVLDLVNRPVAIIVATSQCAREDSSNAADEPERPQHDDCVVETSSASNRLSQRFALSPVGGD